MFHTFTGKVGYGTRGNIKNMGNVFISPNLKKTSERIDPNGNVINPKTKQIITPVVEEYVPPATSQPTPDAPVCPVTVVNVKDDPMDIQAQIAQAEANLEKLKEAKKVKIEEMKKALEL